MGQGGGGFRWFSSGSAQSRSLTCTFHSKGQAPGRIKCLCWSDAGWAMGCHWTHVELHSLARSTTCCIVQFFTGLRTLFKSLCCFLSFLVPLFYFWYSSFKLAVLKFVSHVPDLFGKLMRTKESFPKKDALHPSLFKASWTQGNSPWQRVNFMSLHG